MEAPIRTRQRRLVAGHQIYFDSEGFFWEPTDWSIEVASALASECGLSELGETRLGVIAFLREYYFTNGRAPMNRQLRDGTGLTLMELERLFPGGIKFGARRLAGLPNPKTCLD